MFQTTFDVESTLPSVIIICTFVFFIFNYGASRFCAFYSQSLINEASSWERSGFFNEAETAYQKAVALFDSFLYSPIGYKKKARPLLRKMARFYLARPEKNSSTDAFLTEYFRSFPEDEEALKTWLQQLIGKAPLERDYHAVTSIISDFHADNSFIQSLLAHLFIICYRTDFTALQTYRRYLDQKQRHNNNFIRKLAKIFLGEGRADEWALEIYLHAIAIDGSNKDKQKLLNGLAACVSWMQINQANRLMLEKARKHLVGIDQKTLSEMAGGFHLPAARVVVSRTQIIPVLRRSASQLLKYSAIAADYARLFATTAKTFMELAWTDLRSKETLKWLGIMAFLLLIGVLSVNTYIYLNKAPKKTHSIIIRKPAPEKAVAKTDDGRFTLQVAAYLKKEQAKHYVDELKTKHIKAYFIETKGVSKTWYQVRLSAFADKHSALVYGNKLKSAGIIDDFFVTKL